MGSMSAPDAAPLPRLGEVFFDVRGNSRSMRLSWYADTGVAVMSIWQGGMCTGTFRLAIGDLPRLVETLQRGPDGRQAGWDSQAPGQAIADPLMESTAQVQSMEPLPGQGQPDLPAEPVDYLTGTREYPGHRAGPPEYQPEPPDHRAMSPQYRSEPPEYRSEPPDDLRTRPAQYQAGPPEYQPGPPEYQAGPPPEYEQGPPEYQPGPPDHRAGPPVYQPGPPEYGAGSPEYRPDPRGHRAGPPEYGAGSPDYRPGPPDHRAAPPEYQPEPRGHRAGPPEYLAGPPDQAGTREYLAAPPDRRADPPDHRSGPTDHLAGSPSHQAGPTDHLAGPPSHRARPPEYQPGPPEYRAGSAEYQAAAAPRPRNESLADPPPAAGAADPAGYASAIYVGGRRPDAPDPDTGGTTAYPHDTGGQVNYRREPAGDLYRGTGPLDYHGEPSMPHYPPETSAPSHSDALGGSPADYPAHYGTAVTDDIGHEPRRDSFPHGRPAGSRGARSRHAGPDSSSA
jgi:hypothetical protein